MKKYQKYLLTLLLGLFTLCYTNKVKELSDYNNTLLTSISKYASNVDNKCIEGSINNDGMILGYAGISVDIQNSYSNMKGIGFKKSLVEYKKNKCIINKEDNLDKYIVSGNTYEKKLSLVVDVINLNYYKQMKEVCIDENIKLNYLVNLDIYNSINIKENILFKTNNNNISRFKNIINDFYCVKYNNFEVINYCKKYKISSILMKNYIKDDLLLNTKKVLNNGIILFIKESKNNYNELQSTIRYIKSMGYTIVSVDELLS